MPARFSQKGFGPLLADVLNRQMGSRRDAFPNIERGRTVMLVADFGGRHSGQSFETHSFLILDADQNNNWLELHRQFRRSVMPDRRRMAFKALNDAVRRSAFVPFLQMAHEIRGLLITFAVPKSRESLITIGDSSAAEGDLAFSNIWKPSVYERALRIVHLSAFLLTGLSVPSQNLLWLIDEDEIASNDVQLTLLTRLFANVWSNHDAHRLGHIRCGTAKSDPGDLVIEDLIAIADLSAGAVGESGTAMLRRAMWPLKGITVPAPLGLTWKTRAILNWMATESCSLQFFTYLIEPRRDRPGMIATGIRWHAMQNPLVPFVSPNLSHGSLRNSR